MSHAITFGSPLPDVSIAGKRCHLREFEFGDLHVVEEASSDALIPLITTVPSDWTARAGEAFIGRQRARRTDGVGWSLAIVDTSTNRAVGQIGLWISDLSKGRAEIGYWVAASGRSKGAAADALAALTRWAFDHLDVDRLSVFIEPSNAASILTAERSGFEPEGLLRSWERVGGVSRDMWSFVQTRPSPGSR